MSSPEEFDRQRHADELRAMWAKLLPSPEEYWKQEANCFENLLTNLGVFFTQCGEQAMAYDVWRFVVRHGFYSVAAVSNLIRYLTLEVHECHLALSQSGIFPINLDIMKPENSVHPDVLRSRTEMFSQEFKVLVEKYYPGSTEWNG